VFTSAHCTWKVNEGALRVVLGKGYRDFDMNQELTQVKDVGTINLSQFFSHFAYFHDMCRCLKRVGEKKKSLSLSFSL
jgi:hypothetical protein